VTHPTCNGHEFPAAKIVNKIKSIGNGSLLATVLKPNITGKTN
jgi:hypothetical protein